LQNVEFGASTVPKILGDFLALALSSVAIGMIFGIFNSLLFKHARMLVHSAITETLLMLIIALISYFVSESGELSGIITLLTCGIT
jgi:NhaP-type Na+/H+ or K+/H+ antiporter